jgi:hypothetical protein
LRFKGKGVKEKWKAFIYRENFIEKCRYKFPSINKQNVFNLFPKDTDFMAAIIILFRL